LEYQNRTVCDKSAVAAFAPTYHRRYSAARGQEKGCQLDRLDCRTDGGLKGSRRCIDALTAKISAQCDATMKDPGVEQQRKEVPATKDGHFLSLF
jgi:hypothetical protein